MVINRWNIEKDAILTLPYIVIVNSASKSRTLIGSTGNLSLFQSYLLLPGKRMVCVQIKGIELFKVFVYFLRSTYIQHSKIEKVVKRC